MRLLPHPRPRAAGGAVNNPVFAKLLRYYANSIVKFGPAACLMHHTQAQFRGRKALLREAIKNYVVSMASYPETFCRDFPEYVLLLGETTPGRILPGHKGKAAYRDVHSPLKEGLAFSDIAVADSRSQSLAEIGSSKYRMLFPIRACSRDL